MKKLFLNIFFTGKFSLLEPHIILFRRPLTDEAKDLARKEREDKEAEGRDVMLEGRRKGIVAGPQQAGA